MFFRQVIHPDFFQTNPDHPMIERIVGSEPIRLFFMGGCFIDLSEGSLRSGKLIASQDQSWVALDRDIPSGNCFFFPA